MLGEKLSTNLVDFGNKMVFEGIRGNYKKIKCKKCGETYFFIPIDAPDNEECPMCLEYSLQND